MNHDENSLKHRVRQLERLVAKQDEELLALRNRFYSLESKRGEPFSFGDLFKAVKPIGTIS